MCFWGHWAGFLPQDLWKSIGITAIFACRRKRLHFHKNNGTKLVLLTKILRLLSKEDNSYSEHIEEKEFIELSTVDRNRYNLFQSESVNIGGIITSVNLRYDKNGNQWAILSLDTFAGAMQIYVFSNDIDWVRYEGIQSSIFDHLLAVVPEFGLRIFQNPTGKDFGTIGKS